MTLVLDLTPAEEARLRTVARERGMLPEELARQLIADLPGVEPKPSARVSDELLALGREALHEHASGRTEDFPA